MEKILRTFNKSIFLFFLITSNSCLKTYESTSYLDNDTREWATEDKYGDYFVMVDNNSISQTFTCKSNHHDTSLISTSRSILKNEIYYEERIYQTFTSNFGIEFEIYLQPAFDTNGDDIYFEISRIGFGYDQKFNILNRVNTYFGNIGQRFDSNGNYINVLKSSAIILDKFSTKYHDYDDVMYFQLNDLTNKWDKLTVVKIYCAKKVGLIRYELNNGVIYERK